MLFKAVPPSLRAAIAVGIGFFITIIGLKIGEITRATVAGWAVPGVVAQAQCITKMDHSFTLPTGTAHADDFSGNTVIDFCNNPVDLNFATYDLGMVNFNLHAQPRIAVLGMLLVPFFTILGVRSAIICSIVMSTFLGINYGIAMHAPGWMSYSGKGHGSGANYVASGPVSAVTNLAAWYNFDNARYHTPGLSNSQKLSVSNSFFLPHLPSIPSGRLTFKYANTPIFWEAVWTFLFVEMFDSFGTLTGIMTRAGFMKGWCVGSVPCSRLPS